MAPLSAHGLQTHVMRPRIWWMLWTVKECFKACKVRSRTDCTICGSQNWQGR